MDDIVERLREHSQVCCCGIIEREAADEIERLRAETHDLREQLKVPNPARDISNECNEALAAKDQQIEQLRDIIRKLLPFAAAIIEVAKAVEGEK